VSQETPGQPQLLPGTVLQAWGVMLTIQDLFAQARLCVRAVVQAKQGFVAKWLARN